MFEAVDIITLIKGNNYDELNLDVGEALKKRSDVGPSIFSPSAGEKKSHHYKLTHTHRISLEYTHVQSTTAWTRFSTRYENLESTD